MWGYFDPERRALNRFEIKVLLNSIQCSFEEEYVEKQRELEDFVNGMLFSAGVIAIAVFMRTGDLLFDYNKEVDGKKTLPLILESLDRVFEKNLKASHNYKKPLVILFFNRALRLDGHALSR